MDVPEVGDILRVADSVDQKTENSLVKINDFKSFLPSVHFDMVTIGVEKLL